MARVSITHPEVVDVAEQQAKDKAVFCIATGVQPSEYDNLTIIEIEAFIVEVNRQNKKK